MYGAQVWQLEEITFSPQQDERDAAGVQWILIAEKGFWGSPATGATLSPRLNRHGAFRTPGWKKERIVSLTARCYAFDYAVLRHAEAVVLGLLSDPTAAGTLTCYSEIGALTLAVHLDGDILCTPLNVVSEPGIEFSIQVVAPDPRKYSVEEQVQQTGLPGGTAIGVL
jgi:hypothetical protein